MCHFLFYLSGRTAAIVTVTVLALLVVIFTCFKLIRSLKGSSAKIRNSIAAAMVLYAGIQAMGISTGMMVVFFCALGALVHLIRQLPAGRILAWFRQKTESLMAYVWNRLAPQLAMPDLPPEENGGNSLSSSESSLYVLAEEDGVEHLRYLEW